MEARGEAAASMRFRRKAAATAGPAISYRAPGLAAQSRFTGV
jgi:hypothetical protein